MPQEKEQLNKASLDSAQQALKKAKRNVLKQAGLAVFTVVVVLILVFARTAAWYTNVVSTGGLTFEAEAWGFEGGVTISQEPIAAAPGDEGVIEMRISNTGKLASAVSVNISKEYMSNTEMQQRIYFFADKEAVVNGETVQRQYLSNTGGYTYFLPSQNELILTQEVYTDVQLKWQWVYDVVGYYFRGTHDGAAFTVEEYLRPVSYCYDNALFDETTGALLQVDKDTSAAAFLAEITANDGYAGAFTANQDNTLSKEGQPVAPILGCYPVDEENNIWIYLCTKQEILRNTAWDTQYGINAQTQPQTFQVRISVTGQQLQQQTVTVADADSLRTALEENSGSMITLEQDVILDQPLVIPAGTQTMLNLNGNYLITTANTVFDVRSGGDLTVMDGSISGDPENTVAFYSVGSSVTISNLQITDVKNAVVVADHTTERPQGENSTIRIIGCDMQTQDVAVMISGDGTASQKTTAMVIQDTVISSGYIGISGNGSTGNPGRWGTDIQIVNSTVEGQYAGIYHPQMNSTVTVSGSTVTGWTGIAVKGGSLTVIDSTVTGVGTDAQVTVPTEDNVSNSGFVDSGDGIYVETGYGYPIRIRVSGDSHIGCTAQTAKAVRVFPESSLVKLELIGGIYDTDVSAMLQEGYTCQAAEGGYKVSGETP